MNDHFDFTQSIAIFSDQTLSHFLLSESHRSLQLSLLELTLPILALLVVNVLSLILLRTFCRCFLRCIHDVFDLLSLFFLPWRGIPSAKRREAVKNEKFEQAQTERERRSCGTTVIIDDQKAFADWRDFIHAFETMEAPRNLSPEAIEALYVLGFHDTPSKESLRRAYVSLMKRYHPDLFMNSSKSIQERVRSETLKIRAAYDTLTREFYQAN